MIERYLWRVIAPYFFIAWSLLTTILFLQQGSRFAEILVGTQMPLSLVSRLSAAIILTVIAFTGPMALMVGVLLGLGQLRGDSELTIFEASGISRWRILAPGLMLGGLVSILALTINIYGIPWASQTLRRVALEAAILKLESPIEPGTFNTNIGNYVIYVNDGNNEKGYWEKVFLTTTDNNGNVRLITASSGRIDSAREQSELVLSDAVVTTLPKIEGDARAEITTERVSTLRVTLDTGKRELLKRLQSVERQPDEMGLFELAQYANQKDGKERNEADVLWYRRITLSIAPLILAFAGVALSLRFGRGGRSGAGALALIAIVSYYLLSLLGEQLVRGGLIQPAIGCWAATFVTFTVSCWWWIKSMRLNSRRSFFNEFAKNIETISKRVFNFNNRKGNIANENSVYEINSMNADSNESRKENKTSGSSKYSGSFDKEDDVNRGNHINLTGFLEPGLLELDLTRFTTRFLVLVIGGLWLLFLIFTTFEILRYAALTSGGGLLLIKYLIFFTPLVLWQVAPVGMMLAVLITFAIKSRQSEIVIWEASGFGKSRMIFPVLLYALLVGFVAWSAQEQILPKTNLWQDNLRSQLRGEGSTGIKGGRLWVKTNNGICSFIDSTNNSKEFGFDNGNGGDDDGGGVDKRGGEFANDVFIYKFADDGVHLQRVFYGKKAFWKNDSIELTGDVKQVDWSNSFVETKRMSQVSVNSFGQFNPFTQVVDKLSHLNTAEIANQLESAESNTDERRLKVAWHKRYATIFLPLVQVMLCLPFAFWFKRKGVAKALTAVLGVWMMFVLVSSLFERLGASGFLSPALSVWSPLIIFAGIGSYLLTKTDG